MFNNKLTAMDVDQTTPNNDLNNTTNANSNNSLNSNSSSCTLKRCSSAPMINDIKDIKMNTSPSTTPINSSSPIFTGMFVPRARRFSASFSPHTTISSQTTPRLTPRVSQLRQEEAVDVTNIREVAHEREIHNTMTMSQSWEDLRLMTTSDTDNNKNSDHQHQIISPNPCRMLPLNITLPTSTIACSSPSPTRAGGISFNNNSNNRSVGCFSPGISGSNANGMVWKSMSPSPTRKQSFTTRRSLSPTITMRPSSLGPVKRKFELDDEKMSSEQSYPPFKRINLSSPSSSLIPTTTASLSSPPPSSLSSSSLSNNNNILLITSNNKPTTTTNNATLDTNTNLNSSSETSSSSLSSSIDNDSSSTSVINNGNINCNSTAYNNQQQQSLIINDNDNDVSMMNINDNNDNINKTIQPQQTKVHNIV